MSRRPPSWLLVALLCGATPLSGCYQQIVDAVVDDDHPPGGMVQAQMGPTAIGPLPALAIGEPLVIRGQTETVIFAITCGDDASGRNAHAVLDTAGRQISLPISASSRSQLQFHFGGASCIAKDGQVDLTTGSDLSLSGSFTATGTLGDNTTPCSVRGSLSAIPQYR